MNTLFVFAGEQSGDVHGAEILHAIHKSYPDWDLYGVGGPAMRQESFRCIQEMEDYQVMGFSDVFLALPRLWRYFNRVLKRILSDQPQGILLIDYPGFNMRLAKALRKKGYRGKIIHYVCPSIWAWKKNRIHDLVETLDLLLSIFPFEAEYFADTTLKVEYVGNPLCDKIINVPNESQRDCLGLFPGSRKGEIERNLPLMLESVKGLDIPIEISVARDDLLPLIKQLAPNARLSPPGQSYPLMQRCKAALATSGTVTLELALHNVPSCVVYRLSTTNYLLAKYLFRLSLPYYCIVNIIRQKSVFPELIHDDFSVSACQKQIQKLSTNSKERHQCLQELDLLRKELQHENASQAVAKALGELIHVP